MQTLNYSIFKLVGGLLILTTCAILVTVWVSTTNHAKAQVQQGLDIGQNIFTQVLDRRENQLYNSAEVLTADYGFIQSVASRDAATISSVLHNHGERISADLMALLQLDGTVISSTSSHLDDNASFLTKGLTEAAVNKGGALSILEIDNRVYQVILLTVRAPVPIAIAVIGFEIDKDLAEELASITKLHITIESRHNGERSTVVSSLSENEWSNVYSSVTRELSVLRFPFTKSNRFISNRFLLSEQENKEVWIILSQDLDELIAEFNTLQLEITFITLLSICLAMLLGVIFAKNLTQPLTYLAVTAQRIARGDYHKNINTISNTREINNLSASFEVMQENVRQREEKIQFQARHDLLTKLYNRFQITEIIENKILSKESFQVFGLNILGFRGINDTFGYHIGDGCLQLLAQRFLKLGGHVARLSGGELMWLPEQDVNEAQLLMFRRELEQPLEVDKTILNVRFSIGLVRYPDDTNDIYTLFRRISIAVDHARQQDNLFHAYHQDLEESYLYRLKVIRELKAVLTQSQSELALFYQPKLNLHTGRVTRVEALMRWNSKRLGSVSPELFIPIAEKAGLINQVTDWVINRAIYDLCYWQKVGIHLQVSINLSVHNITNADLLPEIMQRLKLAGLKKDMLSFEITESDFMEEPEKALDQLKAFRMNGFDLALDDFGTGYSSLAYLKNMPVSALKIDKSFILKLDQQIDDQSIVQIIISLAQTFKLETVAEGVENAEAFQLLKSWGCDWIQGYVISKPLPNNQIQEWLKEHGTTFCTEGASTGELK